MGQKVNPIGLRVGVNKDWSANWFANKKEFGVLLNKDDKIRKFLAKEMKDAAVASVVIERTEKRTDVKIYTAKPGVIIGHGGEDIEKLRNKLKKLVDEEIYVSIIEVKNPDLNAKLVAEQIASQIEARAPFRSAQKRAIRNTMKAGAKGIKTAVSGRLGGAEMARTEGYVEGTVPLHTIRADIDYAIAEADTTYGKIGVKVWIYKGEILPAKKNTKGDVANVNAKKSKTDSRRVKKCRMEDIFSAWSMYVSFIFHPIFDDFTQNNSISPKILYISPKLIFSVCFIVVILHRFLKI